MRKSVIIMMLLASLSCRERINPYDPGSEYFATPPPIYFAYPTLGWYNASGYLVGVRIQVDFIDAFPASLSILNVLKRGTEELARESIPVGSGLDSYEIDLISESVMDNGDYLVIFYWSDVSIGSCLFRVMEVNNNFVICNVTEYDTLNTGY
ncbi:hypothetical protein AMJ74_02505 [candidate division WOR_3 bacterium SM1_77]|uniref:Lipoprotein n=1 Tax=candidate division WOR_3 bacterium SM1_77 TaxID=1703778 RepID=A0A0S8JZE2_UNCW3|nr:MAG: hypothetical protein AMJ74_02505 [candidate division WOR_3 bacterium SM1_77]